MSGKYLVVQVRCVKSFVDEFDEVVEKLGYASRSEAVRKFMRNLIEENKEGV